MKKWIAFLAVLALMLSLTACGGGEETTVSGMVVAVDGTVITLMEMDGGFGGRMPMGENGEMPTRPEGMEDFDPEKMEDFTRPEGMEGFDPEKMEDFNFEDFDPEDMPEGFDPENMPEGFGPGGQPPEGERPGMEGFEGMGETTTLDIADAHISVEIDGGKESGSMENIVPGTMVTVTIDARGNATYVLVNQGFGGFGGINFPAMK